MVLLNGNKILIQALQGRLWCLCSSITADLGSSCRGRSLCWRDHPDHAEDQEEGGGDEVGRAPQAQDHHRAACQAAASVQEGRCGHCWWSFRYSTHVKDTNRKKLVKYWIQSTKTQVSVMEPQQWWLPVRRPSRSTTSLHWPGGWRNFFLIGHLMDCVNLLLSGLLVMVWQDASRLSWALDRFHPSRWFEIPVKWIFESTIILLSYHENHTIFLTLGHAGEDWC